MGIVPTLRERGYEMQRLQTVDRNGREEAHKDLTPLYDAQRGRFISVARSELASALVGACQGLPIHFNVSISAIAKDGAKSLVTLTDGRQERFDLVVGADGLHSHVRALSFGPETQFERFLDCYVAAFRIRGYPLREELTFVSHTVRGRQAARVSLRDDETVVLLVCGTERIGAHHHGHGDPRPVLRHGIRRHGMGSAEAARRDGRRRGRVFRSREPDPSAALGRCRRGATACEPPLPPRGQRAFSMLPSLGNAFGAADSMEALRTAVGHVRLGDPVRIRCT